jgi:hypothetical protein
VEAAYFSHELKCGIVYLVFRHRRFEVEEGLDVSTHMRYLNVSVKRIRNSLVKYSKLP